MFSVYDVVFNAAREVEERPIRLSGLRGPRLPGQSLAEFAQSV
jgi:hypothetical protein